MGLKKLFSNNRRLAALILLFVIAKLALLPTLNFLYWDEAVYLAIGKYIYSAGASGFIEIIRPIFLPALVGWIWVLKLNYILFSKAVMVALSAACLAAAYMLSARIFNKKVAMLATLFLIITPVFFGFSSLVLTEVPAALFIMLAIYFFMGKKGAFMAGMFTAFAFSFRFPAGLVLAIISLLMLLRHFQEGGEKFSALAKKYMLYLFSFVLFMLPYLLFNYFEYREETSRLWHALFRPWILGLWHQNNPAASVLSGTLLSKAYNILYYPANLFISNIFLAFIILALVLWIKKRHYRDFKFNVAVVTFLVFLAYFTLILNKQARFSIIFLPFAAMLAAYGFYWAFRQLKRKLGKKRVTALIIILCLAQLSIIACILQSNSVRYVLTRPQPTLYPSLAQFFALHGISGNVMTTDPLPAAYIDNSIIPNFYSPEHLVNDFASDRNITTLVYYPLGIWCPEADSRCLADRERMTQHFIESYNLVFFDNGTETYVFSKNMSLPSLNLQQIRQKAKLLMNPGAASSIVAFRIENAGSLYREDGKGSIWKLDEFKRLNSIFNGTEVTWAIIPADVPGLNSQSRGYLREYALKNQVTIAQKGYEHKENSPGSEFRGLSYAEQLEKIRLGSDILEKEFNQKITVFIPPFNSADENTMRALDKLNYAVYSSTSGDFLYFKDRNINRYDLSISFTDWQAGKNLDFGKLKAQFDSLRGYRDYVIVTVEYYMLAEEDFGTLEKFLEYARSQDVAIMSLKQLDDWYRYRDSVNFSADGARISLFAQESKLAENLTIGFYLSGNFTVESNIKSVNIINLNDNEIDVCLNLRCHDLKPRNVKKVEI